MRKCNQAGINLIQSFESCKLQSYQDTRGLWTIGWGHRDPSLTQGILWTHDKADEQFSEDLSLVEAQVDSLSPWRLTDNQFSALVSFAYNVGVGNFKTSHLLQLITSLDIKGAADEFLRWDHNHDGTENSGLKRRRIAERSLFLSDSGTDTPASEASVLPS